MAKELIFIGSSVCVGSGARDNHGWSAMLAQRLKQQGWNPVNRSIGGQTTTDILLRLDKDVIRHHPDLCVVGLGLANEGLPAAADERMVRIIQGIFEHNLMKIVEALRGAGIRVMLGGVYPNNNYKDLQYGILKETDRNMSSWDVPVFHWLSALDDGRGHFRQGLYHDVGHPNDQGYRVMYEQIPEIQ